jgi:ABC-type multidrug transport system fused ATPase/permease subunit
MTTYNISLKILLKRFWKRTLLTWTLVILEGLTLLFMPLVIGWAIDDLIKNNLTGILHLTALCSVLLIIGAGRRFYDTRVYSGINKIVSYEMISREIHKKTSVSKISARANLFSEFIEFLENSIPDIFNHLVGLMGTLCIIMFIDIKVFFACLIGALLTWVIYLVSQKKILNLNKGQNDEFEIQVDHIVSQNRNGLKNHFRNLMKWNIKLSDLETVNFSLTWIVLTGSLIGSIFVIVSSGAVTFGHMVTIIMYVFGFIESNLAFPFYFQQMVRLHDIAGRLG